VLWTSKSKSQEKQLGAECVEPQKDIWGVGFLQKWTSTKRRTDRLITATVQSRSTAQSEL